MATTTIGELLLHMTIDGDRQVVSAMQRVSKQVDKFGSTTKKASKDGISLTDVLGLMTKGFAALNIVDKIINSIKFFWEEIKKGIKSGVDYNKEIDYLTASITTLTGSQEISNKMTKEMAILAAETPFQISHFAKAAKTLLGYGVAQEEVIEDMEMLGNVSQGNVSAFDRLSLAFGQVAAKGKLQAEEVRQMVNAGFNPLQAIAKITGIELTDLQARMKKGEITYEMTRDAFKYINSEGQLFHNNMRNLSDTFAGQQEKLKEYGAIFWGNLIRPFYDVVAGKIFPKIVNNLIEASSEAEVWGQKLFEVAKYGWDFVEFLYKLVRPEAISFVKNISDKFKDFLEIMDPLIRILQTADAGSIEIVLKALLPDWLEGRAKAISKVFVFLRDDFLGFIESFFSVMSTGDANSIGIMFKALFPEDLKPAAQDIADLFVKVRDGISKFKDKVMEVIPKVIGAFSEFIAKVAPIVRDIIVPIFNRLMKAFNDIDISNIVDSFKNLGSTISNYYKIFKVGLKIIGGVFILLLDTVVGVITGMIGSFDNYMVAFQSAIAFIGDLIQFFVSIFSGDVDEVIRIAKKLGKDFVMIFSNLWEGLKTLVGNIVGGIVDGFKTLYNILVGHSIIPDMVNEIISWFKKVLGSPVNAIISLKDKVVSALKTAASYVSGKATLIYQYISSRFNQAKSIAKETFSLMYSYVTDKLKSLVSSVSSNATDVKNKISQLKDSIINKVKGIDLYKYGKAMVQTLINGVSSKIQSFKNKVGELSQAAKNLVGWQSPTKEGAGKDSDKWIPNLMEMMISGFEKYRKKIGIAAGTISSSIMDNMNLGNQASLQAVTSSTSYGNTTTYGSRNNISIVINASSVSSGKSIGEQLVYELNRKGILTHK